MVLFTEKSLNLMPSNGLTGLSNALTVDKTKKLTELASINAKLSKLQGVSNIKTSTNGRVSVNTGGVDAVNKSQQGMSSPAVAWSNGASLMNSNVTNPSEAPVFVPGTTDENTTSQDVSQMTDEINSYFNDVSPLPNPSNKSAVISQLSLQRGQIQNDISEIDDTQIIIAEIIQKRASGELKEPKLNLSALNVEALPAPLQELADNTVQDANTFVENQIIAPFAENEALVASLEAQLSGIDVLTPVFDLEYGPPISTGNQFVLSEDGLYYNSRGEPVPDVVPDPLSSNMWTLQFNSNVGGRGISFTEQDAEDDAGTIFSLNQDLGTNTPRVLKFYEFDDVLQQFADDRQSHLTQVSGYISEILANGYADTDAVVRSYKSQLGSVAAVYGEKIKKRKRQLEIAAIYGRNTFFVTDRDHPMGEGLFFQYLPPQGKAYEYNLKYKDLPDNVKSLSFLQPAEGGQALAWNRRLNEVVEVPEPDNIIAIAGFWQQIPRIPLNDFSYLQQADIPLDLQRKLTLFSEDVASVVAPYQAKYVIAPNKPTSYTTELAVDEIGFGDWVHPESSGMPNGSVSATSPLYKSLTDDIVSDDLLICYNFLDPEAVTQPSGTLYGANNAAEGSPRMDGKMVAHHKSLIFPSGVGIPYFRGTIFDQKQKYNPLYPELYGSYVRLPNITKDYQQYSVPFNGSRELDNLFYSQKGATLDFWAYVPNVWSDMDNFHRYRLVFANENSGPVASNYVTASPLRKGVSTNDSPTIDMDRTLGMMIGWRDAGSPDGESGYSSDGLEFIIAPTVGQNQSQAAGNKKSWGHSICISERWTGETAPTSSIVTQNGMYIASGTRTTDGSGIGEVSGSYMHFNIAFDYDSEEVRVCLDGKELSTSAMVDVLGGRPETMVYPTAVKMELVDKTDNIISRGEGSSNPVGGSFNNPTKESFLGPNIYDEQVSPERVAFPVYTPWIIGGGYSDNINKIAETDFRPQGFLGSNTNNTYQQTRFGDDLVTVQVGGATGATYPVGQHQPPLSNGEGGGNASRNNIPRSGLDGYLGSFKIYTKPLSTKEAKKNFDSQKGFFKNIEI
tara:strand:- start:8248 stop:11457 length:3210 start_codon:yes stop_codon:yes gene_type:complete